MNSEKWIIFDFDGTLVDSLHITIDVVNKYGHHVVRSFEKISNEGVRNNGIRHYFKKFNIRKRYIPLIVLGLQILVIKRYKEVVIKNEVRNVLIRLYESGFGLAIISSLHRGIIKGCLKNSDSKDFFEFVASSPSLFSKNKLIEKVLKKNKINKDNVWYVGDETRDIIACKKVGIPMVAVTNGFESRELLEKAKPDYLIDSLEELLKVLEDVCC